MIDLLIAMVLSVSEPPAAPQWVLFRDKGGGDRVSAYVELERTCDPRALERRRLRRTAPGLFDERDLPLVSAYIDAVSGTGATVRTRSRWVNAVSVVATPAQLEAIESLDFVRGVQPVASLETVRRVRATPPPPPPPPPVGGGIYGLADPQITQLNLDELHAQGLTGLGVIVGILDTGFLHTHDAFSFPEFPLQVVAEWDFVNDDPSTLPEPGDLPNQHNHGTLILGVVSAFDPGTVVGGAYGAGVILAKAEDIASEYAAEEDFFVAGLEFIEANGGDVATSSLIMSAIYGPGDYDGRTAIMTLGLNTATDNGVHCFQAAGNEGHDTDPATHHLRIPADAIGTISVGAVNVGGTIAGFSSDGPTEDGRVKPELLARGVATVTVDPGGAPTTTASGTSLSTPLAASVAACLVQAHPEWTVTQMRRAFQTASVYTADGLFDPLHVHGYGIIDAAAAASMAPSPADLDGDFQVTVADLVQLLLAWGPCAACVEDLDDNGAVDVEDLVLLLLDWG